MTSVIIMASGGGTRWNNYGGVPKQLARVNGETLLERLHKQIGDRKTYITVPEKGYFGDVPFEEIVGEDETEIDKYLNGESVMGDKAIFILGDTWFTDEGIKEVLACDEDVMFFGRTEPSKVFDEIIHPQRNINIIVKEVFALCLSAEYMDRVKKLKDVWKSGQIVNTSCWFLWDFLGGKKEHFTQINDLTQDFDFPEVYEHFLKKYEDKFGVR